ncbi:hypothetical protein PINS_up002332 [Pythium insidiosum]|nr:hypothetical protein PINS_up002332 [Pythium insidiosum]
MTPPASWRSAGARTRASSQSSRATATAAAQRHELRVLTDELAPHATGRLEDGRAIAQLGATLAWAPNQSLLASHETRKDQLAVVFFERNGLRHGEFSLPSEWRATTSRVLALAWSAASDVLAVHVVSPSTSRHAVLLYARNNYHWFLKQQLEVRGRLHALRWDDERALVLHALTDAALERLEFTWDVCSGERVDESEGARAVVGVVDGSTLQLTPVHRALVPPPMALNARSFHAACERAGVRPAARAVGRRAARERRRRLRGRRAERRKHRRVRGERRPVRAVRRCCLSRARLRHT